LVQFVKLVAASAASLALWAADPVPDFRLTDVSGASPRQRTIVSPRDYIMQVTGFYFGSAT